MDWMESTGLAGSKDSTGWKGNRAVAAAMGRRSWLALSLTLLVAAVWLASPLAALAQSAENDLKVEWQGRYREVTAEYETAKSELATAELEYRKARQRNRLKGARREELMAALAAAEARYAVAKQALDRFPEEAHRAGALPGWFR